MEAQIPEGEKGLKLKLMNYEKNMDQLTMMYHSIATQNKLISKDKVVIDKKLERKREI